MKRIVYTILFMLFTLAGTTSYVSAHPGNTDSSGSHTCHTNCSYWGYSYGEYHNHTSDIEYDYVDYYEQGSEDGLSFVDENSGYIGNIAEQEGTQEGRSQGEAGLIQDGSSYYEGTCSDVDFQDSSSPQDYYDGFVDSYSDGCIEIYNDEYSKAYDVAYDAGYAIFKTKAEKEKEQEKEYYTDNSDNFDWSGLLILGAIVGIPIIISSLISKKNDN